MSKPEQIPQDVERRALKLAIEYRKSVLEDGVQALALTHVIARAMMAATAAEREACAQIADKRVAMCAMAEAANRVGGPSEASRSEAVAGREASFIAIAIRKRGES